MFYSLGCHIYKMEPKEFKDNILPLRSQLMSYAMHFLNDQEEAADITQEVFLKLWFIRSDLKKYNSIPALATQITKHLCLNRIKVMQREWDSNRISPGNTDTPYIRLEQKDSLTQVMRIIDKLPGLQQSILKMKHMDGFEVEQIAQLTGSTPEAVRMNLSRARKKVKELFLKIQQ